MRELFRERVFLIAGPTASGKSALALRLARRFDGVVINADAMQVYRDLRILTARPSMEEEAAVAHRLFGFVDAAENYSVGRWLADVAPVLEALRQEERIAIITGGTGLYFKALVRGLSDIPSVPSHVRSEVRRQAAGVSPARLHARLAASDPQTAAMLRPSDPQRILRALEVHAATGRSLASYQDRRGAPLLRPGDWRAVFLSPDRAALRARIEARFDAMMEAGALEEVRALADRGLDHGLPAMRAHGLPGLIEALRGATTLEAAIERGKNDTRRYVKRQFTFARHQLPEFDEIAPEFAESRLVASAVKPVV